MSNDEIVKCGTANQGPSLDDAMERMMKNKVIGKETVTFLKKDWEVVSTSISELTEHLHAMSLLTPVKGAHGLCKVTVCQWGALETMREKANKDAEKVTKLYRMIERTLQFMDRMIEEKLLAAEGWWIQSATLMRREIEDMKRS